jgi:hypothetical protein
MVRVMEHLGYRAGKHIAGRGGRIVKSGGTAPKFQRAAVFWLVVGNEKLEYCRPCT